MGLKENLSRLSPNEFLEKMQDMFQMYQESQDDYYEEGLNEARKDLRNSDSSYNTSDPYSSILNLSDIKKTMSSIIRFIERLYAGSKNRKADAKQAGDHMKELLKSISLKEKYKVDNLYDLVYMLVDVDYQLSRTKVDPLIVKHWSRER